MRLFVAVDLDEARRDALARVAGRLRRALEPAGWGRAIRWVAPSNLHLTVRFLGETDEAACARVTDALAAPLEVPRFEIVFAGAGVFPPRGAPRVLWVGLARGTDGLARVFDTVEARLGSLGVPSESRPLSPHLTLGRVRDRARGGRLGALMAALAAVEVEGGAMPVTAVTLHQSRLTPAGPEYRPLARAPLAGA